MKKGLRGINPASKPSGDGCVECLASPKGWCFISVGVRSVGTSDAVTVLRVSMPQSMRRQQGHPIITSFKPGEDWFFDYEKRGMIKGVELPPPHAHPAKSARTWTRRKGASTLGIAPKLAARYRVASR